MRFGGDEALIHLRFIPLVLVLNVLNVRYDAVRIEEMLFTCLELFIIELLALYTPRVDLFKLR